MALSCGCFKGQICVGVNFSVFPFLANVILLTCFLKTSFDS
jgi:hypothetical protein